MSHYTKLFDLVVVFLTLVCICGWVAYSTCPTGKETFTSPEWNRVPGISCQTDFIKNCYTDWLIPKLAGENSSLNFTDQHRCNLVMNYNFDKVQPPISSCHHTTFQGPKLTTDQNRINNSTDTLLPEGQTIQRNMSKQATQILDTYTKKCHGLCYLAPGCKSTMVIPSIKTEYNNDTRKVEGNYQYDCYVCSEKPSLSSTGQVYSKTNSMKDLERLSRTEPKVIPDFPGCVGEKAKQAVTCGNQAQSLYGTSLQTLLSGKPFNPPIFPVTSSFS